MRPPAQVMTLVAGTSTLLIVLSASPAASRTLRVPDEYERIQPALNAAEPGDTVLVAPGTYSGDWNRDMGFLGNDIVLRSEMGAGATVIDSGGSQAEPHRAFYFHLGESAAARVEGFTIRGGFVRVFIGEGGGGGILCVNGSTPTIVDCVFDGNRAAAGGAIACRSSPVTILGCTFAHNEGVQGGAISLGSSAAVISGCTFVANAATGADDPFCSGIYSNSSSPPQLSNCIIADGIGLFGEAVQCATGTSVTLICCDLHGNEGGDWVGCIADQLGVSGNISVDPLFCNATAGIFTLAANSPCLPGNDPLRQGCGLIGAHGEGCPPSVIENTSWGRIKWTIGRWSSGAGPVARAPGRGHEPAPAVAGRP
ncbi:MAG: right-handed parallel beta-helix repeat-containing protein [Candidatus Eiseniibacteriota bacterium]|jgi:predicted outer membrane repeat protein